MDDTRKKLMEALAGIGEYGRRSARNFGMGIDNGREVAQDIQSYIPPVVDDYASMVSQFMPGTTVVDAMRMGGEAGRLWTEGNYPDALDRYGDAILAPLGEVSFLAPGGPLFQGANKGIKMAMK